VEPEARAAAVRLVAIVVAIFGAACLAAVVAASPPWAAALAIVGAGMLAVAATEIG